MESIADTIVAKFAVLATDCRVGVGVGVGVGGRQAGSRRAGCEGVVEFALDVIKPKAQG